MNKNELMDTLKRKGYHAFVEVPNSGRKEYLTILSRNFKLLYRFPFEDLNDDIEVYFPMTNIIVFPDIWKKYVSHHDTVMEDCIIPFIKFFKNLKDKWMCNAYYGINVYYENHSGGSTKVSDHKLLIQGNPIRTLDFGNRATYKLLKDFIIRSTFTSYAKDKLMNAEDLIRYLNMSSGFHLNYHDLTKLNLRYPYHCIYDMDTKCRKPYLTKDAIFRYNTVTYLCTSNFDVSTNSIKVVAIHASSILDKDIEGKDFTLKIDCNISIE